MFNWVDFVIVAVVIYNVFDGWKSGIVSIISRCLSFLFSLWAAIAFHTAVGNFFVERLGISSLWSQVIGYVAVALAAQVVALEIFSSIFENLPEDFLKSRLKRWLGALFSMVNALVLTAFFLLVTMSLPVRGTIRHDVKKSILGSTLWGLATTYGGSVTSSLNEASLQATQFITVEPTSTERVILDIAPKSSDLGFDAMSEKKMIELVNNERAKRGLSALREDMQMVAVARAHSRDMFVNKYFSHIDVAEHDAKDRMLAAGIVFQIVGENLAYAPDVTTAHTGLMNSQNHKENILGTDWHRIGIGIIDSGNYGEMFTQLFAD